MVNSFNKGDTLNKSGDPSQGIKTFVFCLMTVICSAFIPVALSGVARSVINIWSFAIIAAGIAFMFMLVRRMALSIIVCLFSFYTLYLLPDPTFTAVCMSAMLIFVLGTTVCSIYPKKRIALLLTVPAVAYLGAFALTRDPILSLSALIFIPSAASAGIMQRKCAQRKTVIATCSIILILIALGIGAGILYVNGMLDRSSILALVDGARDWTLDTLSGIRLDAGGEVIELFDASLLPEAVDTLFNVLPGLIVASLFVVYYFFHSILFALYRSEDLDLFINSKTSSVQMSTISAVLFVTAYIFSFTTDSAGNLDLVSAVAENLRIILTPGLLLAGIDAVGALLRKLRIGGLFFIILIIAAFMWLSDYILLLLAALGAIFIIVRAVDEWAKEHYKENTP